MRTKFKQDFVFTIQTNNFACFCDSNMQQWSVHFDGEEDLEQFAQQIKSNGGKITYYNQSTDSSDNVKQPLSETEENKNEKDSDSHSDTSQNKTKANILSRMAKMGQSILPTAAPKTASDSETDDQESNRKSVKKRQKHNNTDQNNSIPQTSSNSEYVIVNGQLLPMASINQNFGSSFVNPLQNQMVSSLPNQFILPQVSDSMHVFIAENRTHNCEVRMNMSQFSAKLDKVLEELNKNKTGVSNYVRTEDQENKLEESKNIIKTLENKHKHYEEIIQDNKQNIEELLRQIENQEKKILDQELQIRDLIESKNILEASQKNIDEQKILVENLKAELIQKESGLEQIDKLFKDKDSENLKLLECNDNLAKQIANTDSKVDMFNKKLKQSMNVLYQKMMEHFEDESAAFQSTQIKKILSHHLKTLTFSIIQEFENDFKNIEQIEQKSNTVAPPVPTFDEF